MIRSSQSMTPRDDLGLRWLDIKFPMAPPKTVGSGNPTLVTWNGSLRGYSFAVGDVHDFNPEEIDHNAKVGSTAYWHVHFVTRDNETEATVKYQIEYALEPESGAVPAPTTVSAEYVIPAGTAVNTVARLDISGFQVDSIARLVYARMTRIASSGTEPSTDPVVGALHFHYQTDDRGSRLISSK